MVGSGSGIQNWVGCESDTQKMWSDPVLKTWSDADQVLKMWLDPVLNTWSDLDPVFKMWLDPVLKTWSDPGLFFKIWSDADPIIKIWSDADLGFKIWSKLDPGETGGGVTEPLRAGPGPDLGSDNSKLWIIKLRTSLRLITYALPGKI